MSASKSDHDYNYKTDFEIWRENQEFGRNCFDESTTFVLDSYRYKHNKYKTSHLYLNHVGKKTPYPKQLTLPTESSERNKKEYVPEDPDSDPSSSDSSSSEYDSYNDIKCRKYRSKIKSDLDGDSK